MGGTDLVWWMLGARWGAHPCLPWGSPQLHGVKVPSPPPLGAPNPGRSCRGVPHQLGGSEDPAPPQHPWGTHPTATPSPCRALQ